MLVFKAFWHNPFVVLCPLKVITLMLHFVAGEAALNKYITNIQGKLVVKYILKSSPFWHFLKNTWIQSEEYWAQPSTFFLYAAEISASWPLLESAQLGGGPPCPPPALPQGLLLVLEGGAEDQSSNPCRQLCFCLLDI
jgi:hypothetical protein